MRRAILFLLLVSPPAFAELASTSTSYSPKICLRTNSGILRNQGSQGGESLTLGALDLSFLYPLGSRLFVGLGYQAHFDFSRGVVPYSAFDVSARVYFWGQGTRVHAGYLTMESETIDNFSAYVAGEFGTRNFFLGAATSGSSSTASGNSLGINAAVGGDIRLSRHLQLNLEANAGVLSFASSDERFNVSGLLFKAGLAYLW
jgi:hypothetical protein